MIQHEVILGGKPSKGAWDRIWALQQRRQFSLIVVQLIFKGQEHLGKDCNREF